MEKIFNELINSFLENRVGISENFLSNQLAADLKNNLEKLYDNNSLERAGTGGKDNLQLNSMIRRDIIYWLDREHNDVHENSFFALMDSFISYLNETCYTGIRGYEFHYTMYEAGSFYKKHIDQFRGNDSRKYSVIMYLNEHWKAGDGGELCVYHEDKVEDITPVNGKMVFFKSSELQHEVLVTNVPRMSITGWLKT